MSFALGVLVGVLALLFGAWGGARAERMRTVRQVAAVSDWGKRWADAWRQIEERRIALDAREDEIKRREAAARPN